MTTESTPTETFESKVNEKINEAVATRRRAAIPQNDRGMAGPRRPINLVKTLERVKVPAAVGDRHGTITWANKAGRTMFGDVVGRPFSALVAPEHVALVERQRERMLRGVPMTNYEVDVFTADGRRRRAEISAVPIEGGDEVHAIFGIAMVGAPRPARPVVNLTPRQNQVLRLLGDGASTEEIAASLHLSTETVRNYVRHILRALGAHSRLDAVVIAHREGLLANEEQRSEARAAHA